jgi:hypothetical protein
LQTKSEAAAASQQIGVEASSTSSGSTMDNYKKVVWPSPHHDNAKEKQPQHHHHQHEAFVNGAVSANNVDKPLAWMKDVASEHHHLQQSTAAEAAMELEIQKRAWDATTGRHLSRSRSKSKNIMERARSFERAAAEAAIGSNPGSRAPSRQGSFSNVPGGQARGRRRSPSVGRQLADYWQTEATSRPASRAGRERSVGRLDTAQWEATVAKAKANPAPPPKTPPQKRRPMKAPSPAPKEPEISPAHQFPRHNVNQDWPHAASPIRKDHERLPSPPPPPPPRHLKESSGTELSAASIQTLSKEDKDDIVEQWVRQSSTQQARDELEQFAYEIAESVVSTLERSNQANNISTAAAGASSSAEVSTRS